MQAIGSHGSNGDGERSGPTGRMEKGPQVTCKPSGPTGQMKMENGPQVTRKPLGTTIENFENLVQPG